MATNWDLTAKQLAALEGASPITYRDALAIGAAGATLSSLANRKFLDRRLHVSSLRGGDHWAYRLTGTGVIAMNKAHRAKRSA